MDKHWEPLPNDLWIVSGPSSNVINKHFPYHWDFFSYFQLPSVPPLPFVSLWILRVLLVIPFPCFSCRELHAPFNHVLCGLFGIEISQIFLVTPSYSFFFFWWRLGFFPCYFCSSYIDGNSEGKEVSMWANVIHFFTMYLLNTSSMSGIVLKALGTQQ